MFSPAHVFPWHMFSHGTCFLEAHVFPRFPVVHVFLRHTFHHGTYFPKTHVFPLHLLLMKQTLKRNTVSQYRSWHICSHGICFPTAHVFPRHMCSHGLPWHMFSPGTRFTVTYFPVSHVHPTILCLTSEGLARHELGWGFLYHRTPTNIM